MLNRGYAQAAGDSATLWEIPESRHVGGSDGAAAGVRATSGRLLRQGAAAITRLSSGAPAVAAAASPPRPASLLTRLASAVRARSTEALRVQRRRCRGAPARARRRVPPSRAAAFRSPSTRSRFGIALVASVARRCAVRLRCGRASAPRSAFTFGVLAAVNGGRHAHHIINEGGTTANDVTGALALLGRRVGRPGPCLRHLRAVGRPRRCCRSCRVPLTAAHAGRDRSIGARRAPPTRLAVDGSRRRLEGASVLVLSGGGGNRRSTLRHAKMLVRHGYGVLALRPARHRQQRGHHQLLRLGLGEGRRRRARLPRQARRRRAGARRRARPLDRRATSRSTSPPAATTSRPSWSTASPQIGLRGHQGATPTTRSCARPTAGACSRPSRSSRAAPGPRRRSPTRSRSSHRAAPDRLRRQAGEGVGRALRQGRRRPLPPSGTCRTRATRQRYASTQPPTTQRVVSFLDTNLRPE